MKTVLVALCLIGLTAFAAPAAAACSTNAVLGTRVCLDGDYVSSRAVYAEKQDVGSAGFSSSRSDYGGRQTTYTDVIIDFYGKSVVGPALVTYESFCTGAQNRCHYQYDDVFVSSGNAGFVYLALSQTPQGRQACHEVAGRWSCATLP